MNTPKQLGSVLPKKILIIKMKKAKKLIMKKKLMKKKNFNVKHNAIHVPILVTIVLNAQI